MSKSIQIEDDLYAALERQAQALGLSPVTLAHQLLQTQLMGSSRHQSPTFQRNWMAFQEALPTLLQTLAGHYVAFFNGQLVGSGEDRSVLMKEMYAKYGYVSMLITQVTAMPRVRHVSYHRRIS